MIDSTSFVKALKICWVRRLYCAFYLVSAEHFCYNIITTKKDVQDQIVWNN